MTESLESKKPEFSEGRKQSTCTFDPYESRLENIHGFWKIDLYIQKRSMLFYQYV